MYLRYDFKHICLLRMLRDITNTAVKIKMLSATPMLSAIASHWMRGCSHTAQWNPLNFDIPMIFPRFSRFGYPVLNRPGPGPCYVEFVLEHSPSVSVCSVRSPPFYPILPYYSVLLHPLLLHPCPYYVSVYSVSSFQLSTLGSDPFQWVPTSFSYYSFGYNPYQPNPIAPRFLIVFCSLLSYDPFILIVPICINHDKLY